MMPWPDEERSHKKPRVFYLIYSNHRSAGGGSFYSLQQHVLAFGNMVDAHILNLGKGKSAALRGLENYSYIPFVRWNLWQLVAIVTMVRKIKPNILHAYDHKSLFVARIIRIFYPITIIFTKCGGSNGSNNIPEADIYILFSRENFLHYKKFSPNIEAHLIPNRIYNIDEDMSSIMEIRNRFNISNDHKVLMRISRVSPYYNRTYSQCHKLYLQMKAAGEIHKLIFVGDIQDEAYFKDISKSFESDEDIIFITDPKFTRNASRILPIADAVVATGRGVMEACFFGLRVFCPSAKGDLPIELDDETFEELFSYNFSERVSIEGQGAKDGGGAQGGTRRYYDENFSVLSVKSKYWRIYSRERGQGKMTACGFFYHMLQFFRPRF